MLLSRIYVYRTDKEEIFEGKSVATIFQLIHANSSLDLVELDRTQKDHNRVIDECVYDPRKSLHISRMFVCF